MLPKLVTEIPGPRSRELAAELRRYESRNVTYVSEYFPVFWERAAGANVWDVDGNCFLDLTAAFAVAGLGHTNEAIRAAATDQLGQLFHGMGDVHPTELKVRLCRELSRWTYETWSNGKETGKTILTNSGSEAVEAALKTAFLATGKPKVLGFEGAYHGLGYGSLAASGIRYFHRPFHGQLPHLGAWLPFPCYGHEEEYAAKLEKLLHKDGKSIGAIIVEPIQGRAGDIVPPDWFLPLLRQAADQHGILLIFDEIYTGFYRTGKRFAADHWGVVPDLICLGKALTGGFPLAATVGKAEVMDAWPESPGEALHTSTFLGNPLGCRMALASLAEMERLDLPDIIAHASRTLELALHDLRATEPEGIRWGELRGRGLMRGLELFTPEGQTAGAETGKLLEALLARGIIQLAGSPTGNVLAFSPPLIMSDEQIHFALQQLQQAAQELKPADR